MNEDVRKALRHIKPWSFAADHQVLEKALRDQEAEIAEWSGRALREQTAHHEAIKRAEKADALLRECVGNLFVRGDGGRVLGENTSLTDRITAHLGATHDHP